VLTLFISDLHIDESRPDITRAFLHFLDIHASHAEKLYILGDFFDTWIGDDYILHEPKNALVDEVLFSLKKLSQSGLQLYFMHGNRDFLLGNEFMRHCGGTLLDDPTVIQLGSTPTLLMHGDSLCTEDIDYMKFRAMARSPEWIQSQLSKPITERLHFAQHLRKTSMEKNRQTAENILDVSQTEVLRVMEEHSVTQLIHGHTHRPKIHQVNTNSQTKKRYVLGDWEKEGWYLAHQNDAITLHSFPFAQL
jgi:UDP-2,3-diacylglucosamine hydrolase